MAGEAKGPAALSWKGAWVAALAALTLAGCGGAAQAPGAGGQPAASPSQQAATPGDRHVPSTLTIAAIGVSATVEQVGVDQNGNMAIPADPHDVAWYEPGVAPGEAGNAVIDGHLDWYGIPQGPFYRLNQLKAGDEIDVKALDGTTFVFKVSGPATVVPADATPPGLFSRGGSPTLTLITCGGDWDPARQEYTERRLVNATLAAERRP